MHLAQYRNRIRIKRINGACCGYIRAPPACTYTHKPGVKYELYEGDKDKNEHLIWSNYGLQGWGEWNVSQTII